MDQQVIDIVKKDLQEFGFDNNVVDAAIKSTNSTNMDTLLEWIDKNQYTYNQEPQQSQQQQQNPPQKMEEEKQPENQEPNLKGEEKPIHDLVSQELVKQLMEIGHSKNVSEKALFISNQQIPYQTVDQALDYIEQHKDEPDFQEQLFFVQPPQMSKEEAIQKAKELQKTLRAKREKIEAETKHKQEIERIARDKKMRDNAEQLKEAQRERDMDFLKRQKQQDEIDKQKILEKLENDKKIRLGDKYVAPEKKKEAEVQKFNKIELFQRGLAQILTAHPYYLHQEKAETCFKTIKAYLSNIKKNPDESKFHKIKIENKAFNERVNSCCGGISSLEGLGFEEDGEFLHYKTLNLQDIEQALNLVENYIQKSQG